MSNAVLALNTGSSSIKFAVYRGGDGGDLALICKGLRDQRASDQHFRIKDADGKVIADQHVASTDGADPVLELLDHLKPMIGGLELAAVGHRIVHGGPRFCDPVIVDQHVL